ncbi:MAG: scpA 1, partial [Deltaproteobacteria bacterium]|nr:scpA 1 [Deltaproteobacteria bacterium]
AVTISTGQTTTATGTYALALQTGSLQVTISPQGAIDAGARWRREGTSTWLNSGAAESAIPVGQYTVEFSDVVGWTKQGNQTVTISSGQTTAIVGTYTGTTAPFLFFDDFSTDKGWSGFEMGGWERKPAYAGSSEVGNPDPAVDRTPTEDNYILGYAIGGDYTNGLSGEREIISPAINCTGQERVFLKFWRYLNIEGNDRAEIYVSNDRTNWLLVWENPESGVIDSQWIPVVYDISGVAAGEGSVYIKFTMGPTDPAGCYSGWNIDDLEVNSNPVHPAEGTIGTEFSIAGSDFGSNKGKVLIGNTPVTVLSWSNGLIRCRLTKGLGPGTYDVTIVPSLPKGAASIVYNEAVFLAKPPEIRSLDQGEGTAWDQITVQGRFFGTKKGKVYLEYEEDGNPVRKNCKVLRWAMDPASGEGEIVFVVPSMMPEVCDVVVDPSGVLPETEEQDGFTVMAPEIVSVDPNVGTVGNEITIHGYFFGTKKPKVYLGYDMNGKPKKKSCPVVRWTVLDPATGEGNIVCQVPKGLSGGIYDVIVANSVGSDTEPDIFTMHAIH